MAVDQTAFLDIPRRETPCRPVAERRGDFREVIRLPGAGHVAGQSARCMNCGTAFCHWSCPLGNCIPEWNRALREGRWPEAAARLLETGSFPEITGRLCPAPCENACVLGIHDQPVTIRENELAIAEHAFQHGLVRPATPPARTGKKVAVIGSGPAGLAAADQLNRSGHLVTVFEKDDAPGGILRYGIPDFKLDKAVLDRRLGLMKEAGIEFTAGTASDGRLRAEFAAVLVAVGAAVPRDLAVPGRELRGITFAMEYLVHANRRVRGGGGEARLDARGRQVVVVGGGDTGADCVGVALRQGAASVVQLEIMPAPPAARAVDNPWPRPARVLKKSTSHEEGGRRAWSVTTGAFFGRSGQVRGLVCRKVRPSVEAGRLSFREIAGSDFRLPADLVILAAGFLHAERQSGPVSDFNLALDARGNIATDARGRTSATGVFAAGDCCRGPSLVVHAIAEGRRVARAIDHCLGGAAATPGR